MDTVQHGAGTVQHRRHTGRRRSVHGADPTGDPASASPMTDAVYVRLPHDMALEVRARAADLGQCGAEWVRDRIASSLRRPRPRARGQGRAPTPGEIRVLVGAQEQIAGVCAALPRAEEAEARAVRPDGPGRPYATTVPLSVTILRGLSAALVDLIVARRRP